MKKIIVAIFMISYSVMAQKVTVMEGEESINDVKRKGLYTIIELEEDFVKSAWTKRIKEFGSMKTKSGTYIVEQASIGAISPAMIKIASKVDVTTKGIKVFYSLDLGDAYISDDGDKGKFNEAVKILHDFAVTAYLDDINEQVKEAEKILKLSVRDQEKMISKGESIRTSILDNRQEKIKFEKKLEENAFQYKQFKIDSTQNVQNQAAAVETVEKMKRAVEAVRGKISKVE
jgi:hypothetical protein